MSSPSKRSRPWSRRGVEEGDDEADDDDEESPLWRRVGSDAPRDWAATALADALAETSLLLLPPPLACEEEDEDGGGGDEEEEDEASETEGDAARARTTFFLLDLDLDDRCVAGPFARRRQSADASESEGSGAAAAPLRAQGAAASTLEALRAGFVGRSGHREAGCARREEGRNSGGDIRGDAFDVEQHREEDAATVDPPPAAAAALAAAPAEGRM